ncbi:MAG TPA: hypothetical protein VES39_01705, partial [Rhodospirillales bacterium]|nr:hypothetical protein [Rhodospirillales bacterium]
ENGRLELFRNYDEHGNRLPRPRTLLTRISQMRRWMGDAAERIVYGDQYVIVSSVVLSWLIQRVNREKLLFSSGSIAGSS